MDYWIVKDNRTGKIIANCGSINDAIMLVEFDPDHRTYHRHRFIGDQVITINATVEKQLDQQIVNTTYIPKLDYHKNRLPEGEGIPINITL